MKRKKIIPVLFILIVFVAFAILAGCGPGEKPDDSKSKPDGDKSKAEVSNGEQNGDEDPYAHLTIFDFEDKTVTFTLPYPVDRERGINETQDRRADRLEDMEELYNVTIEFTEIGGSEYFESVVTQILGGENPGDFMNVRSQEYLAWLSADIMRSLNNDGILDFKDASKFNSSALQAFTANDKVMAIPDTPEIMGVVYFNKRMFEEEGLESPYDLIAKDEWTFAKFEELARKLTKDTTADGNIDQWGIGGYDEAAIAVNMICNNDASIIKIEDGKPVYQLNTPNAIEALNFFFKWFNEDQIAYLFPDGASWDHAITAFQDGKIAMVYGHDWFRGSFAEMEDDYGVVVPPRGPKGVGYKSDAWKFTGTMIPINSVYETDQLLALWDGIFGSTLYPEEDEWDQVRISYETSGTLRDKESIETFVNIRKDNLQEFNGMELFNLMYLAPAETQIYPDIFRNISRGKAVSQAVEEKEEAINTYIQEMFGN